MKYFSNRCIFQIVLPIVALFAMEGLSPISVQGATVPTITLPKRTITIFDVAIVKPQGNPITAGSIDNEFIYIAGVATILVKAAITPLKVQGNVADLIKWTFPSVPSGSALTWNNSWSGESSAGKGLEAVATLTGYPTHNDQFGVKTIKMEVIRNGKVLLTKTAELALFYERDAVVIPFTAPNWFRYWNETPAGNVNAQYTATLADFGMTPAMYNWSTYAGPRRRIVVGDSVTGSDLRRDGSGLTVTGIDLFANTILHENYHVQQIYDNNAQPFFTGRTGALREAASAGWSFNMAFGNILWNHFTDSDASNSYTVGDVDLDTDADDIANTLEPTAADRAQCYSGSSNDVECQAELRETSPEDTFQEYDWGYPGKRYQ